jgi:hypothetical protein
MDNVWSTCPGRKSRPLRDQLVSSNSPKGLFILSGGSSNGCAFSASTGVVHAKSPDNCSIQRYTHVSGQRVEQIRSPNWFDETDMCG